MTTAAVVAVVGCPVAAYVVGVVVLLAEGEGRVTALLWPALAAGLLVGAALLWLMERHTPAPWPDDDGDGR